VNAIDFNNESTASVTYNTGESTTKTGSGTALSSPTIQTNYFNDEIVHTYGSASTISSVTKNVNIESTSTTSTGFADEGAGGAPGTGQGSSLTATGGSAAWVGETFAIIADQPGCSAGGSTQAGACTYGLEVPPSGNGYVVCCNTGTGYGETFYATAISQAQAQLDAHSQSGSQKVIVLLSDGDANIDGPDACKEAIQNAENAEADGIWIISIAYESSNNSSSSCPTDTNGSNGNTGTYGGHLSISALCTMELISHNPVSDPTDFAGLSTTPETGTGYKTDTTMFSAMKNYCTSKGSNPASDTGNTGSRFYNVVTDSQLADVFAQLGESLSTERLVSDAAQ